jgi:FAD/FMN-containing dehydrogenase
MEPAHERALRDLEEVFGDRLKRGPAPPGARDAGGALASASPMGAEVVEFLVEVARRYSVPLVALGAGTASTPGGREHTGSLRPDARAEVAGTRGALGRGGAGRVLAAARRQPAYPGMGPCGLPHERPPGHRRGLAGDCLGVGSYEYGWLSENVLSASVVLPGGERREVPGEDLRTFIEQGRGGLSSSVRSC